MRKPSELSKVLRRKRSNSFTLIELLTVMAIIAILASLVLYAGNGVMLKAKRSRASAEIQAMSTALEGYKTDNGIYPPSDGVLGTNNYSTWDPTAAANLTNAVLIYIALSGQTNYAAGGTAGVKSYMTFKGNQVGNPAGPFSYVKDPYNYPYGYSTGTTAPVNYPYNGNGFFDLFSTGGQLASGNTNAWLSNWQ